MNLTQTSNSKFFQYYRLISAIASYVSNEALVNGWADREE